MKETEHSQDNYLEDIKTHFMNTIWEQQTDYERAESKLIELIERYATAKAKASCEATLIKAAENAYVDNNHIQGQCFDSDDFVVNKSSITDPSNIVIL